MTEGTFSSPEDSIPTQSEEDTFSRSEKGPLAFRTISEVADELHVPQHVLRFWETRFEQVRPLKRGGGVGIIVPQILNCCVTLRICFTAKVTL